MNLKQNLKFKFILKQGLFAVLFSSFFFSGNNVFAQKQTYTVVLDAGHGGKDPGKIGYLNHKEKDVALDIVLSVGEILQKQPGIKVIYTRKTDVFVDLMERGNIANKADADLFVSVHCNAHDSQAHGAESWVLGLHANKRNFEVAKAENEVILLEANYEEKYKGFNPNLPESFIGLSNVQEENLDKSLALASLVQNNFTYNLKRVNRGVKQAGFVVLHHTYMPSVLIETGFLTNHIEGPYLSSTRGKSDMAIAISSAIIKYIDNIKINTVASAKYQKSKQREVALAKKEIDIDENKEVSKELENSDSFFSVQIATGRSNIKTSSTNFKGLNAVFMEPWGSYFKYFYGKTNDYEAAKQLLAEAKEKGYVSAFIVGFKNGEKVSVSELIK